MSENSVKYGLELVDKASGKVLGTLTANLDKAENSVKKLGKSGSDTFDQISVHIGKATGIYDIFAGNLAANIATKAFDTLSAAAGQMFNTFVTDGVKAAQSKEQALNALNVSLAQTGQYSRATSEELDQFIETLERSTGVEGDAIMENAALIQSLGWLEKDGLKRATQAAVDLSAALGIDLATASTMVGKAAAGEVGTFSRYGIELQKGATDAQTFARALDAIESRFGGSAVAKVNTFSGALSQTSNLFGELQEEIGNVIVKNNAVIEIFKGVSREIMSSTDAVKSNNQALKELVAQGFIGLIQGANFAVAAFDVVIRGAQMMYDGLKVSFNLLGAAMVGPLRFFSETAEVAFDHFTEEAMKAADDVRDAFTKETGLEQFGVVLARLENDARNGFDALKSGVETAVEPVNRAKTSITELSEEQKKLNNELTNFVNKLAEAATSGESSYQSALVSLQLLREEEKLSNEEYYLGRTEAENLFYAEQVARADAARANGLVSETQHKLALEALEKKHSQALGKIGIDRHKDEEVLNQKKVRAVADTFGNMASLMATNNRKLFEIGKAAAIASATVNTYEAITKTMASVPYPFNIPLAAAQGVAGFVQVANISAQQPRFENGGIVPGSSFAGDKVQARVNSGEMILNKGQQAQLFKMANGQGGSDSGLSAQVAQLALAVDALANQPLVVEIDGKVVATAVRSQMAGGRSIA